MPVIGRQNDRPACQCGGLEKVRQMLNVIQRPCRSTWIVFGKGVVYRVENDADERLSRVVEARN
nr:hypothetical protein [Arthrobacter sp. FW306-07-I]